jgi:hypothetical protein
MVEWLCGMLLCHVICPCDVEVVSSSPACVDFYFFQNIVFYALIRYMVIQKYSGLFSA